MASFANSHGRGHGCNQTIMLIKNKLFGRIRFDRRSLAAYKKSELIFRREGEQAPQRVILLDALLLQTHISLRALNGVTADMLEDGRANSHAVLEPRQLEILVGGVIVLVRVGVGHQN